MTRQVRFAAVCASIIAFELAFVLPKLVALPVLYYQPLDGRWTFTPHGMAMDWYGRTLFASLAGVAIYWIVRLAARSAPPVAWTAGMLASTAVVMAVYLA